MEKANGILEEAYPGTWEYWLTIDTNKSLPGPSFRQFHAYGFTTSDKAMSHAELISKQLGWKIKEWIVDNIPF